MPRNGCVKMINETMLQGFEWYLPADAVYMCPGSDCF